MRNRRLFHTGLWCRRAGWLTSAISLLCAIALFLSWHQDEVVLRQEVMAITENLNTDSARIHAVNNWVYHNKGFASNDRYFILPALGPTPIQVMERGGDCSDKSRLVAAMLDSIGIHAGLVMISPCLDCGFIHTVVEAQYENRRMVVDPIWNIDYPTGDGGFLGVMDLAGTSRGRERIVELQHQRPATDKIASIPEMDAMFDYAVAMNWKKNIVTQTAVFILRLNGYQPEFFFRPRLLEDPKLLLAIMLTIITIIAAIGGYLLEIGLRFVMMRIPRRMTCSNADKLGATDG